MKKILLLFICVITAGQLFAQTTGGRDVSGIVQDTTKNSVIAATVKLTSDKDTISTRTNVDGGFTFKNVQSGQFTISITSLGLAPFTKSYTYPAGTAAIKLPTITVASESNVLKEVVISGVAAVTIKEDTVQYKASDYKVRENATTEDLLKKLEGVEVDATGNVTAQGKAITKVRVNGKDYFGGDVKTATQNLPAALLESIQVVDDYGDQANVTGVRTGEPEKVLNIVIKPENNKGYYANATAGSGGEDNATGLNRYQASLNGNYFNNDQQIALLSNFNNNNTSTFNFGSQGGGQQGGNRGAGGGGGGITSPSGITQMSSLGLNYRDQWGKTLSSYGSYSFFDRNNNAISTSLQQNNFNADSIDIKNGATAADNSSTNHRASWNFEWKPNTTDYVKFTPNFTYSSSGLSSNANTITQNQIGGTPFLNSNQALLTNTSSTSPSYGGNLLYNHRFGKTLRNISLNVSLNRSNPKTNQDANSDLKTYADDGVTLLKDSLQHQLLSTDNKTVAMSSRFLYIEPLGQKATLEFNYNYNRTNYDNNRQTYDLRNEGELIAGLSNTFNYSFTTNNIGLTYRFNEKKYNYQIGMSVQPTLLDGEGYNYGTQTMVSTRRTGFNFVPVARFVYKFSRTKEFNINYNGRSVEPSYAQINPVEDRSNNIQPVFGNPNLNAAFNHNISLRFNNFNFSTGRVLFFNINSTITQNQIVSNIVTVKNEGVITRETYYLNAKGNYSINGFYNYSIPFAEKKYTLSYGGNIGYSNNVSFSNSLKNIGENTVISQRLRLVTYPVSWIEFDPTASFTYNKNKYDVLVQNNSEIKTWNLGGTARVYFLKSFTVGSDVSKSINQGYQSSVNITNPLIMNAYLEKQFFKDKRGTLRLTGFDLFNQNTNISHYIDGTTTTDSRSNSLGRYFMLSLTMRIQKFGAGGNPNQNRDRGGFPGGDRPGGGFPGGGRPGGGFPGGGGGFPGGNR